MTTKSQKELHSLNADYDPLQNHKLCLLYEGGFAIQKEANLFLQQLKGLETGPAYQERLKCSAYIPYLWEFTSEFSSSLFSETLEVKSGVKDTELEQFYKDFINDCDLNGTSLHAFFHQVFERALYEMQVYVGLDFPKANQMPNSRLEEESLGLSKGYAYTIPYDNVIDWKCDPKSHKFIWLKIFEECFPNDDPISPPTHYFQFKIWTIKNGVGHYQLWTCATLPIDKQPTVNTKYTLTEEGDVSFPEIPIYKFCIPKSYHMGMQEGALCQEHYQRRSFMVSNANKTCVSIGVMTLGPDMGAPGDVMPPDIEPVVEARDIRRKLESEGWVVIRQTDKWADKVDIVEAKGESHKFVSEELTKLVEAMMQTLRQMHMTARATMGAAQQRTAASKMIDMHGVSMLLSVYQRLVYDFVRKFFVSLAAGRNQEVEVKVEGLSTAQNEIERKDTIQEVSALGIDIMKYPEIFKNKYLFKLAMDLLDNDMDDEDKIKLQEELMAAVAAGDFDAEDPNAQAGATSGAPKQLGTGSSEMSAGQTAMVNPPIGPDGIKALPPGSHTQTGQHIDPTVVYNQLKKDYKPKDIQWVKSAAIRGPVQVQHSDISFAGEEDWKANQPGPEGTDKVDKFSKIMDDKGFSAFNPVLLASTPKDDEKYVPLDGRHRVKAAQKSNIPVVAYIVDVGSTDPDTPHMQLHGNQITGNNSEGGNNSSGG